MGTFTENLEIITKILGISPLVCEIDKPERTSDRLIVVLRHLADAFIDDAPQDTIYRLLQEWRSYELAMQQDRNLCRLGQIVQLVNAGLVDIELLKQINTSWAKFFHIFLQYSLVIHPQYYVVCEIDSRNVEIDVIPGVISSEMVINFISVLYHQGRRLDAANILSCCVN